MNHKIFAVHDVKAKAYLPPFFMPQTGMATRIFTECVNSAEHQFGKHPADYTLFQIGEFEDHNATINPMTPKSLGSGVEFVQEKSNDSNYLEPLTKKDHETNIGNGTPIQPGASG